jgi:2-C-methyl-D-erythritol 4-phosphate cytidylyltransferase
MIEWSLDAFRAAKSVRSIVVAAPPEGESGSSEDVRRSPGQPAKVRQVGPPGDPASARGRAFSPNGTESSTAGGEAVSAVFVAGGATRAESVSNALRLVETEVVAIHDAARPLVTSELIEALVADLEAAPEAVGVIAATPITDTVKRVAEHGERVRPALGAQEGPNAGRVVEHTLDRSRLWAAQTPQVFRTAALREALGAAERLEEATDESMLVETAGGTVLIHPTGFENLKVTTPLDLELAEILLSGRSR